MDALLGAVGEHLAERWGLRVPDWTRRPAHFALCGAAFSPGFQGDQGGADRREPACLPISL